MSALTLPSSTSSEPSAAPLEQASGLDSVAVLALVWIVVMMQIVAVDLRATTAIGLGFKNGYLRNIMTVLLGFLALGVFVTERRIGKHNRTVEIASAVAMAVFTLYVATFTFLGQEWFTNTALPVLLALGAAVGVVALWRPWERLALYGQLLRKYIPALVIFVVVLSIWEGAVTLFSVQRFILPAPSVIGGEFTQAFPRLVVQSWYTFQNALWGYAIGCGAGLFFGLITARFGGFSRAVLPYAIAINSIPIIAMAPIMNQWFGSSAPQSKIAIVVLLTFFPVMINTVRGLTSVPNTMIELMRSYAASELSIFRKLRIPVALPFIFNALKVATTLSMIAAVVSEYFGGPLQALGVSIRSDAGLGRFAAVWSKILIASILGLAFYFVVSLLERLVMPWHISFRNQED